jgi:thymidylate synthase ThyX
MDRLLSDMPLVQLTKAFSSPYDNAVATARTCYSSKLIFDHDVSKNDEARALRDKIAKSTYLAGHHTTLQHAHFQFALANVSRHALWGFFHAHPFYNSEQVSQRYVAVKKGHFLLPHFAKDTHIMRYQACIERQQNAYAKLNELLHPICEERFFAIFPGRIKNREDKRWQNAIKKRCQEIARYILPIATHAHLYHTISGLTLLRYQRLAESGDCPVEQKLIVSAMVDEVKKIDPDFFKHSDHYLELDKSHEAQALKALGLSQLDSANAEICAREFDIRLAGKSARLVSSSAEPERILAHAVREVLWISKERLSDKDAIALLLSPKKNPYLSESLNLLTLGKLSRALDLVHFTFMKKISHSADSQAQRHRMIPGARPQFARSISLENPDYITPLVLKSPDAKKAKALFDTVHEETLQDMKALHAEGAPIEAVQYLLTNAYPIRFTDSASLLDHLHKWTTRLCYNAQEEIWQSTVDEVLDLEKTAPEIARYVLPPCGVRKEAEVSPLCPEGERFCGVPVWKMKLNDYHRLL